MDTAAIYKQKFLRTGVEPVTLGSQFFRYSPTLFQLSYRRPYTQQSGAVFHCRRVPRWHIWPRCSVTDQKRDTSRLWAHARNSISIGFASKLPAAWFAVEGVKDTSTAAT
jgi:hypothetical protein